MLSTQRHGAWSRIHILHGGWRCLILLASAMLCFTFAVAAERHAPVMLANRYHAGMALADYWISEKYDGVRAYWDGQRLWTRGGEPIQAPAWFIAGWPAQALDGELWAGRGRFQRTVSIVRKQHGPETDWRDIRFMVFDLPAHDGIFDQRLAVLQQLCAQLAVPWLLAVAHTRVADHAALQALLARTVAQGGEGLMLHRGGSHYRAERNDDLLKFKPYEDSEAVVVGHTPGKGKYAGQLGALLLEMPNGVRFKVGSGLSDAQRRQPPALGSVVTYRYRGFNASGIPRFAVFMRVREE